ncbi:hypothetical protein ACFSTI_08830 [Rhizorhabdus histidinilytica]
MALSSQPSASRGTSRVASARSALAPGRSLTATPARARSRWTSPFISSDSPGRASARSKAVRARAGSSPASAALPACIHSTTAIGSIAICASLAAPSKVAVAAGHCPSADWAMPRHWRAAMPPPAAAQACASSTAAVGLLSANAAHLRPRTLCASWFGGAAGAPRPRQRQ